VLAFSGDLKALVGCLAGDRTGSVQDFVALLFLLYSSSSKKTLGAAASGCCKTNLLSKVLYIDVMQNPPKQNSVGSIILEAYLIWK